MSPINGQWIGRYSGTSAGLLAVDLDDATTVYAGVVCAYDDNPAFPRTFALVDLPKNQNHVSLRVALAPMERGTGNLMSPELLSQRLPGVGMATYADTEWAIDSTEISLTWKTDIGTTGAGKLVKSEAHKPSTLVPVPDVKSWEDFKKFVFTLEPYRFAALGGCARRFTGLAGHP